MKWKSKEPIKEGTTQIVKRFAFFPITEWLPTDKKGSASRGETVWLETVYIRQLRVQGSECSDFWSNREFVTEKEYEKYLNS